MANIGVEYPLSITSSGKEVIATGTVHSFGKSNIEITLSDLRIILEFIESNELKFEAVATDQKTLVLKLQNFNNSIGNGFTEPIYIGNVNNRKLYIVLTVYSIVPNALKHVHYTFYMGEAINVPQ